MGEVSALSSASIVYLALNAITVLGLFKLRSDLERITAFSLLAALLCFISASAILLGLRHKELVTITPAYFLLISIGLVTALEWLAKRNRPQLQEMEKAPQGNMKNTPQGLRRKRK